MSLPARRSASTWVMYNSEALAKYVPRDRRGLNSHMLIEDLANHPYLYRPALHLESENIRGARNFVSELLSEDSHYRRTDADSAFWDFFQSIVEELYNHGRFTCELFGGAGEDEGEKQQRLPRLSVVPQWSLRRLGGTLRQRGADPAEPWRSLEGALLIDVRLPRPVARDLRRTRRRLAALDRRVDDISLVTRGQRHYDFSLHQRKLDEMSARATAGLGWDGRGLFMKRATDSFRIYRQLHFTLTWLRLVDVALNALDRALVMSAAEDAPRSVTLEGVPTAVEIQRRMRSVVDGSEPLDDIRKRLIHPPRT